MNFSGILKSLIILSALVVVNCSVTVGSCFVDSESYCVDYNGSAWESKTAALDCQNHHNSNGVYTDSQKCPQSATAGGCVATCVGLQSSRYKVESGNDSLFKNEDFAIDIIFYPPYTTVISQQICGLSNGSWLASCY